MKRCPICVRVFPPEERFCSVHGLPLVEERLSIGDRVGDLSGQVLDHRYRLAGVAGQGGMGVVYEAENLRIGRRCAVKVLHPQMHADEKMRMRLFREVQATSRIQHQNVVEILDYGYDEHAGGYLVMEFLEGQSLTQLIRQGPLPLSFVFKVGVQLTAGLAATHGHGLIHRDLKPSNVFVLPSGRVKVLDFGLVKPYERSEEFVTISTGGIAFGTPWYMSPEQASFKSLDPRSDIYSLGVILYELFVGRPPFQGDNPLEIIEAQLHAKIPLPSALDPPVKVPAGVEMLLLKALAKNREERHQSMAELMDDLYGQAQRAGLPLTDLEVPLAQLGKPEAPASRPAIDCMAATQSSIPPVPQPDNDWTVKLVSPEPALAAVRLLTAERRDGIVERIVDELQRAIPRYRTLDVEGLKRTVGVLLDGAAGYLNADVPEGIGDEVRKLTTDRTSQQFTLTELIGALWMGFAVARPVLQDVAERDFERYVELEEHVDRRTLPYILKIIEHYVAGNHAKLIELNEVLARRNEELEQLRVKLAEEMRQKSTQLAEAEQLKARVTDVISQGLMLIERGTRRLLMFNKAMEKLTGINAGQLLDRPMDEMLTFVEGVPFTEFVEQIRLHGEVGLRKLRLRLANGVERSVYVRGQAFYNAKMEHTGTLFVIDDVTEREQVIDSFSRYVSRDVVDRVLRQGKALTPGGEPRWAVLLAVNICDFRATIKGMAREDVVQYLNDYVRTIGDAVFHHGGMIDTVGADGILVYFGGLQKTCAPAIAAAKEAVARLEGINEEREKQGKAPINAGIGIHAGDVLVVNVGGERRMVHTIIGDAAQVALALRDVASPGEVLITNEVREAAGEEPTVEPGPVVQVRGQDQPLEVLRLIFSTEPVTSPVTTQVEVPD